MADIRPRPGFSSAGKCTEKTRFLWQHPNVMRWLLPWLAPKSVETAPLRAFLFHAGSGSFVQISASDASSQLHFRFEKTSRGNDGLATQPRVTLTYSGPFSGLQDFAKNHQLLFFR